MQGDAAPAPYKIVKDKHPRQLTFDYLRKMANAKVAKLAPAKVLDNTTASIAHVLIESFAKLIKYANSVPGIESLLLVVNAKDEHNKGGRAGPLAMARGGR